eukprot:9437329-Pyramimonas_sp.AAC.2
MQKGGDMSLIGQFGVGFYSVYLVADYVEVISKHNDDVHLGVQRGRPVCHQRGHRERALGPRYPDQHLPEGGCGRVRGGGQAEACCFQSWSDRHERDSLTIVGARDCLRAQELVGKYSEFINFPIYLYNSKEVSKEVPIEDDEEAEDETEEEVEGEEEEEEEEGTTRLHFNLSTSPSPCNLPAPLYSPVWYPVSDISQGSAPWMLARRPSRVASSYLFR